MTPGQYLYLQRRTAGFTLQDVALRIDTDPPIGAKARERLLASIEADLTRMLQTDAAVLAVIPELHVDLPHLLSLIREASSPNRPRLVAIGDEAAR